MNDYSDLFSQHEPDPLLRELNGNVLWRYEPMDPHDQRPPMSSTAPFQAVKRIKELEAAIRYIIDAWADEDETGDLEDFCRIALGEKSYD
jgi:hypothetical protein